MSFLEKITAKRPILDDINGDGAQAEVDERLANNRAELIAKSAENRKNLGSVATEGGLVHTTDARLVSTGEHPTIQGQANDVEKSES